MTHPEAIDPIRSGAPGQTGAEALAAALADLAGAGGDTARAMPHVRRLWFTPWRLEPGEAVRAREARWLERTRPVLMPAGRHRLLGFELGTGPTVLLVHGWGDYAARMGAFAEPLADRGLRVLALDLPGHGDSGVGTSDLYEFTDALVEIAGCEQVQGIVAHSMGAQAVAMAVQALPDLRAAALLAPAVTLDSAVETFARLFAIPEGATDRLRSDIEGRYGLSVWERCDAAAHAVAATAPALLLHSKDDEQVSSHDVRRLASAWPGARVVEYDGLGHNRLLRDHRVVEAVADFVATMLDARPSTAAGAGRVTSGGGAGA